ncbi:MAG TPA: alpha/beta fold hydrolase, partial [Actinomycetota bacterium]|nr:alpha/beta fold hydrolase [Actinomycetota bacterium]
MTAKVLGYDEAGEGDVLLLVHGFPLDRTLWAEQLAGLSDIRRVVAVDLRGRGKSPDGQADGWSIDLYADDIAATIDSLGVDQVDLAGLSMGGYVVFNVLRKHPEKVRSLILIDTKSGDDPPEAKEGREKTAILVREKGTAELVNALLPKLFAPVATDAVKDKVRAMFENTPSETAAADALAMRDRVDSTPDLAEIKIPTLVLHGADDALMPSAGAKDMASAIPG